MKKYSIAFGVKPQVIDAFNLNDIYDVEYHEVRANTIEDAIMEGREIEKRADFRKQTFDKPIQLRTIVSVSQIG